MAPPPGPRPTTSDEIDPRLLPVPYVIDDKDWPAFAMHESNAAYERYGIMPGAFVDEEAHILYASFSWAQAVFDRPNFIYRKMRELRASSSRLVARRGPIEELADEENMLGEHECGHDWMGYDHRTTILGGFLDALRDGFDTRAFTRLLRRRWNKAIHSRYVDWRGRWSLQWETGKVQVHREPQV